VSIDHLNPHLYGMDGSYQVSGAGMTYLLAKRVDRRNMDMAYLAVIGAVGDFQDTNESRLVGLNRDILNDAVSAGDLVIEQDLRIFGRETRPIIQFFQYCNEPKLNGLTDNPNGCMDMLEFLNIPVKKDGEWRTWNDLTPDEKERITNNVLELVPPEEQKRVYGEVYTLPKFEPGTGLRDAKEYSTILNSCGRYDDAVTGMRICCGDITALEDAEQNRADHRRNISSALTYVKDNHLIRERKFIQYFDAGDKIRETVVGIVAGMLLNTPECRRNLPIIAFVDADDGVKVSSRANRDLADRGLDLSIVMKTASELVGGYGGGHSVAAGATIPPEKKEEFLDIVEDLVSSQII
jgi:RecJ-like exonuclease